MSDDRLATRWAALRRARRVALIPCITAGVPDAGQTAAFLAAAFLRGRRAAVDAGSAAA